MAPRSRLKGLTKRYGKRRGVDDVSFAVRPGEICALLGPNGAGKTTTMRMLVGLSRPDHGSARLLGQPIRLAAEVLARVGVVIDGPAFVPPQRLAQPTAPVARRRSELAAARPG